MRSITTTVLALLAIICANGQSDNSSCYKLVWSDEFNSGTTLNNSIWNIEVNGSGGGNNELQYYTNRPENLRIEGGNLVVEARKENYQGMQYTSGRITTQKKAFFKYGKIEARMKLPYGKGMWPAFWMLGESISTTGWPNCGEIDIMELVGGAANDAITHTTLHWGPVTNGNHPSYGLAYTLPTGKFADDFHVFAVEWNDQEVSGFCDGNKYYTMKINGPGEAAFRDNFFILLNLAVGGNWPGNPDANTVFPQQMLVDYVRVFKKTSDFDIIGKTVVNENESNLTYSVTSSIDSFKYKWIVPQTATAITNLDSNAIALNWGCSPDTLKLEIYGECDTFIRSIQINLKAIKIKGDIWVDTNAVGKIYTVDSLLNATFSWSTSDGVTINGSTTAKSVTVDFANEGKIFVEETTSCSVYKDSIEVKFGDGQFPYPNADKPAAIPGKIIAGNYDSGGEGKSYHDLTAGNSGNVGRINENVDLESNDNSTTIGWFDSGEWVEYTVNIASQGTYKVDIRVASQPGGGSFSLYLDNDLLADKIAVGTTGGWATFKTVTATNLFLPQGKHVLKVFSYGNLNLGNMTFALTSGIASAKTAELTVYPNPVAEKLRINLNAETIGQLSIFSTDGKLIQKVMMSASQDINVSNLSKGLYILKLVSGDTNYTGKFLKE